MIEVERTPGEKLGRLRGAAQSAAKIEFHLSKGWYNEIVRSQPLSAHSLRIGPRINYNRPICDSPAWNIVQSYYAVYEFVNALVFTNTDNLSTEEHRKSTRHFNRFLLGKLSRGVVRYPFCLTAGVLSRELETTNRKVWQYQYAHWPRADDKTIFDLHSAYLELIADAGTFIDFLYGFRVWANYLGIATIIELEEGYYLRHLYQNLATVCFFYGVFAELMALSILGEERLVELLQNVAHRYILRRDEYHRHWYYVPVFVRFRIYRLLGLLETDISFLTPTADDPLR